MIVRRTADKVGLISYKGNKYSVLYQHQRAELYVKEYNNELIIMDLAGKVIATAILDRLLHHAEPLIMAGDSYRMKDKMA